MFDAVGTEGTISVNGAFRETMPVTITRGDEEPEVMQMTSRNRFEVQIDEFSECVLTGKQPEFPPDDAPAEHGRDPRPIRVCGHRQGGGRGTDLEP